MNSTIPSSSSSQDSPPIPKATDSQQELLSESSWHQLRLECFDECVWNDLPQYLIRIRDMRLFARHELRDRFRPLIDVLPIDFETAREVERHCANRVLREVCKKHIKPLLKFAIFSHRWGIGEPTFKDMSRRARDRRSVPPGPGYQKLHHFCEKAKEDYGCEYAWSDTCCINKESSAELEEAIRSMYRWYEDAYVCIVHLAETSSVQDFPREPWFTRGWTLQELLASNKMRMYGKDWTPICPEQKEGAYSHGFPHPNDKESRFMLEAISNVTDIDAENIHHFYRHSKFITVSERMSWASKRKTTRLEDVAYSLLGIFNISIPIAYGEGEMAFRRLLEAIAQRSSDPTLFSWTGPHSQHSLALPSSPASYEIKVTDFSGGDPSYAIQKLGVRVKLLLVPVTVDFDIATSHFECYPRNVDLRGKMTISSRFPASGDRRQRVDFVESPARHADGCALGVLNFDWQRSSDEESDSDDGFLYAGKRYFCLLVTSPRSMSLRGMGLVSVKLNVGSVLPIVECKIRYTGRVETVCLLHKYI